MKQLLTCLISLAFVIPSLLAQHAHPCGTNHEALKKIREGLLANKARFLDSPVQFRDIQYLPIKFHLVAESDGSGRVKIGKVLDQLCALNEDFAEMNVQFYIHEDFNYLNNTAVYENHTATENSIMSFQRANDAINIWMVDDASPNGQSLGTTLGYYTPQRDWIVMRNNNVDANDLTLPHEMGHFFDLPHPFNGWDFEVYDPAVHGTPAPALSPVSGGQIPTETMDGLNCETAGDYICDTPPDYGQGFGWGTCNYTGGHLDPNGVPIDPDESNTMSYFLDCPRDEFHFSLIQQELMLTDLAQSNRNYIRSSHVPNLTIPEEVTLISPVSGATTENYNAVNLEWTASAGADAYLLEIDRVPTFALSPIRQVVYGNSKVVEGLDADKTYFWRVRPFNAYRTCVGSTNSTSFTTGTLTNTIELPFVNDWLVSPNPVKPSGTLSLQLQTTQRFEAQITLFDLSGKQIQSFGRKAFESGDNTYQLGLSSISTGVYLLQLQTPQGALSQRIVVQ